ncbi:MAG: alpha/beta hydrolase [Oscillospiraceae bacterium]|nr:alpha/beta hydrolase [Oscillospiraceae bacterium]
MTEKYLHTLRGDVYYLISENISADKHTVFFFPGLTADHTLFDKQISYFECMYNLIVWDSPAHGKSRPYNDFSFENTSDDIFRILKENGISEIIAVGQSMGGYYAQAFMLRYPSIVKGFIGIGTTPYGEEYYSESDKFWLRHIESLSLMCPTGWLKKAAAKQACTTEYGYENMMKMTACYDKKEYCHLMQSAYAAFLNDNCDLKIECPVLITHGEYDRVGTVKKYCRMWTEKTGFPLRVIKGAGHNANADNPDETNHIIEDFISSLK